ncbi:hypothetical protein ACJX0J_028700, partial [Zea mays]
VGDLRTDGFISSCLQLLFYILTLGVAVTYGSWAQHKVLLSNEDFFIWWFRLGLVYMLLSLITNMTHHLFKLVGTFAWNLIILRFWLKFSKSEYSFCNLGLGSDAILLSPLHDHICVYPVLFGGCRIHIIGMHDSDSLVKYVPFQINFQATICVIIPIRIRI